MVIIMILVIIMIMMMIKTDPSIFTGWRSICALTEKFPSDDGDQQSSVFVSSQVSLLDWTSLRTHLWTWFARKTVSQHLTIKPCCLCFPPFTDEMQRRSWTRHVPCNVTTWFFPLNCRFVFLNANNNRLTTIHKSLTRVKSRIIWVDMVTTRSHATMTNNQKLI